MKSGGRKRKENKKSAPESGRQLNHSSLLNICLKFFEGTIEYLVDTLSYEHMHMRIMKKEVPRAIEKSRMEI